MISKTKNNHPEISRMNFKFLFIFLALTIAFTHCSSPPEKTTDSTLPDLSQEQASKVRDGEQNVLEQNKQLRMARGEEANSLKELEEAEASAPKGKESTERDVAKLRYTAAKKKTVWKEEELAVSIAELELMRAKLAAEKDSSVKVKTYEDYLSKRKKDRDSAKEKYEAAQALVPAEKAEAQPEEETTTGEYK